MGNSRLDRLNDLEELADRANYKLNRMAILAGVSERHLRRYIEVTKHQRPRDWLLGVRLRPVAALQKQGMSVKEMAAIARFKQTSHFSRVFSRTYGHPPSQSRVD